MAQTKQLGVQLQGDAGGMNSALGSAQGSMMSLKGAALGLSAALGAAVVGGAAKAVSAAATFESQMADVEKVTNPETARKMGVAIKEMAAEMPVAHKELALITEEAGRLGIEGPKNIKNFTKVTAQMSVATDMMAQEAAKNFAKLTKLTGTPIGKVRNLGAAINALSNNAAASASEITDAMLRSAGSMTSLGLTVPEIMSLNTTVTEVSSSARRAGTRLRRLASSLQDPRKIKEIANAYGMNADELERMRDEAPLKVINKLVTSMQKGGSEAEKLGMIFNEVSTKALRKLAANYGSFRKLLDKANVQMAEAGSLQAEYNAKMDTFNTKMQIMRNRANNAWMAIGDKLLPSLTNFVSEGINPAISGLVDFIKKVNTWQDVLNAITNASPKVSFIVDFVEADWDKKKQMIKTALEDTIQWGVDLRKDWGNKLENWTKAAERVIGWTVDFALGKNEAAKEANKRINWIVDLLKGSDSEVAEWIGRTIEWNVDLAQGTVQFTKKSIKNAIDVGKGIKKEVPFQASLDVTIKWLKDLKKAATSSDPVKNLTKKGLESPVKMTITGLVGGAAIWKAGSVLTAAAAGIPGGSILIPSALAMLVLNKIDPTVTADVSAAVKSTEPIKNLAKAGIEHPVALTVSAIAGGAAVWKAATAIGAVTAGIPGGTIAVTGALAVITIGKILDVTFGMSDTELEKKVQKAWDESNPEGKAFTVGEGTTLKLGGKGTKLEPEKGLWQKIKDKTNWIGWMRDNDVGGAIGAAIEKAWGGAMKQFSYSWPSIKLEDISSWAKSIGQTMKDINWDKWTTFSGIGSALGNVEIKGEKVKSVVKKIGSKLKGTDWGDVTSAIESGWGTAMKNYSYSWPSVSKEDMTDWFSSIKSTMEGIDWNKWTTVEGLTDTISSNIGTIDIANNLTFGELKTPKGWKKLAVTILPDWVSNPDLPTWAKKLEPRALIAKWIPGFPKWVDEVKPIAAIDSWLPNFPKWKTQIEPIAAIGNWKPNFPGWVDKGLSIIAKLDWKNLTPSIDWPSIPGKLSDFFSWQSGTPWTGSGPKNELAGFVHNQEAVIPADTLRKGADAVLDFLNMPNSKESGGNVAAVGRTKNVQIGPITIEATSREEGKQAARGLKQELESANF